MGTRRFVSLLTILLLLLSSFAPSLFFTPRVAHAATCTGSCYALAGITFANATAPVQNDPQPPVFGGYMYVANRGSNTVSVIQGTMNIANVTVGQSPLEPALDRDTGSVYVPNSGGSTVSVLSGPSVQGTVQVGQNPVTPAYDPANGYVYVPNSGGCSLASQGSQCGDTVTVVSGTGVVTTLNVGMAPEEPTVNTDSGSPYYGYVYVPNAVPDSSGQGTITVISGNTDQVVSTLELGSSPPSGAFFDPINDYVYAGPYVINGTSLVSEISASCDSSCVLDPYTGDVYSPGNGQFSVISGTSSTTVNCPACSASATFDPLNGWMYMHMAVSGTAPFAIFPYLYTNDGPHDSNSFDPTTGYVDVACGGCYTGGLGGSGGKPQNVVFFIGNTCLQEPAGYYNDTVSAICGSTGTQVVSSQPVVNGTTGLPEALGGHIFSVQIDAVALATGRWNASSVSQVNSGGEGKISFIATGPNGTTGFATIKILKTFVSVNLLAQLAAGSSAPPSSFKEVPTLYIDGEPAKVFSWTADSEFFYITFRVHFSTHIVTIAFTNVAGTNGAGTTTTAQSSGTALSSSSSTSAGSSSSSVTSSTSSLGPPAMNDSYVVLAAVIVLAIVLLAVAILRRGRIGRNAPAPTRVNP